MIKYTPSQEKAIYTKNKSLLLSAAAGSGKTAVLVARILDIISDEKNDINITDLLVVTFTNLAAAQMKERIYKEVTERIRTQPKNKKLKKQLLYLSGAKIKTIHSFCLDVIRENIAELDIPVNFRIADENEEKAICETVIGEFIEEKYKEYDEDFLSIINTYAYGRDDSAFSELILSLNRYIMSLPDREKYTKMCISYLNDASEDFGKSVYQDILLNHAGIILKSCIKKYDAAIEAAELSPDFDMYAPFFSEEKAFMERLSESSDIFELSDKLSGYAFPTLPRKKTGTDNTFFKEVRKAFKDKGSKNIQKVMNKSKDEEEAQLKTVIPLIKNLFRLEAEFWERLSEEKKKRGVLTFGDFEHLAYGLLKNSGGEPSAVAKSLRDSFYEILIDEYQDTSDLQNSIFELISKDGKNLFTVGDVKQSIYKFRHAKPELFIKKAAEYEKDGEARELIRLSENFRSRHEVIDSVNRIFSDIMTEETSMTDYTREALIPGADFPKDERNDYTSEMLIFSEAHSDDEDENGSNEGQMIAERIKKLFSDGFTVYDSKTDSHRAVNYGDIVILTRDMTKKAECIYNSLIENGIPVSGEFSGGFYDRPEVSAILSILNAIDNPYNDFYIISLLKSPPFHFTEEELLGVRIKDENVPFFEALKKSDAQKSKNAVSFVKKFSQKAAYMNISELITEIYASLGMYERFSALKNYEQRIYHLDLFRKTACEFEKTKGSDLKGFLTYIKTASKNQMRVKNIYENKNPNSVKMLTMHKSKGLEFPVVFVSGLGKSLKGKDNAKKLLFHPELGAGADYICEKDMYVTKTLCKNAVKIKQEYEQISEELRILYVALTRAKEKLIMTANIKNVQKKEDFWETVRKTGGHTLNTLFETACFADWIMPSAYESPFFNIKICEEPHCACDASETQAKSEEIPVTDFVFSEYHHIERTKLPLKVTVTYANRIRSEEEQPQKSRFSFEELDSAEDKVSGSVYGTYFHKMFELCDIEEIKKGKNVKDVINELFEKDMLEKTDYSDEAVDGICSFFETPLGHSLLKSRHIEKEMPFLIRINADEIFEGDVKDEILLQGTTDCWFEDENGITLLDFKTDKNPDPEKIRKNYSEQIRLYAYALAKITQKEVKRRVIYAVRSSQIIEF